MMKPNFPPVQPAAGDKSFLCPLPESQSFQSPTDLDQDAQETRRIPNKLPKSKASHNNDYYDIASTEAALTPYELVQLRRLLNSKNNTDETDADSEYSEFPETTHAWAVFADKPQRRASKLDRIVGTFIIVFQLFTYSLFVAEAIEDYQRGVVPIFTTHENCEEEGEEPDANFQCEAEVTNHFDAAVAFIMLGIFLTPEILQAARAVRKAPMGSNTLAFALLALMEVVCAFVSAAIAISYQLYIGEVTDAIEVGVGLLFVRELSARAYHGIRHKGVKQYKAFGAMLSSLLIVGFLVEALCEKLLARKTMLTHDW